MYEFRCLLINLLLKRSVQDAQLIDVIQICTPFHLQLKLFFGFCISKGQVEGHEVPESGNKHNR